MANPSLRRKRSAHIVTPSRKIRRDERGVARPCYSYTPRGINNRRGTCYLNTALQCLLAVDAMRERFTSDLHGRYIIPATPSNPELEGRMTYRIKKLFSERCGMPPTPIMKPTENEHILRILRDFNPRDFSKARGSSCSVALHWILHLLSMEELQRDWRTKAPYGGHEPSGPPRNCDFDYPKPGKLPRKVPTFVQETFGGYSCFTLRCNVCNQTNQQFLGPFIILSIPPVVEEEETPAEQPAKRYSVADFFVHSALRWATDLHRRRKCNAKDDQPNDVAYKPSVEFSFIKAPPVLIIRLQMPKERECDPRFKKMKIEETLDLTDFVHPEFADKIGSCKYKLAAFAPIFMRPRDLTGHTIAFINRSKYPVAQETEDANLWRVIDDNLHLRGHLETLPDSQGFCGVESLVYEKY